MLPSCGMKNAFITLPEVKEKWTSRWDLRGSILTQTRTNGSNSEQVISGVPSTLGIGVACPCPQWLAVCEPANSGSFIEPRQRVTIQITHTPAGIHE
jgi:hypothetical protein